MGAGKSGGTQINLRTVQDDVLLYCLGIGTHERGDSQLEQLSTDQWAEIVELSVRHGVAPLLYYRLRTHHPDISIPASVAEELRDTYLHSAWKNTRRYHELSKVLQILQNEGIPVIVLKGAALAALIYQNIALRPMCDVDLLVRRNDIWKTSEVFSQLGYENKPSSSPKRCMQWIRNVKYMNRLIYVEIHPNVYELPHLAPWINASPKAIASTDNTFILGAEDFLLHLCLHLNHHFKTGTHRLIWWYDIAEVLERYQRELDWNYAIRIAKEHRVEEVIHSILCVINERFHADVPAEVLSQLKNGGIVISINDVLHPARVRDRELVSLSSWLSAISRIPSIHSKIHYLFRWVFPSREFMIHHYSLARPNRVCFYYFVRIGEAIAKAVKALYQLPSYLWNRRICSGAFVKR